MTTVVIILAIVLLGGSSIALAIIKYRKRRNTAETKARNLDLAMVQLNQQIRRSPNDGVAFAKRGIIRHKKGDVKGAIGDLERAIELDPANTEARCHHGMALQEVGDLKGAESEFTWIMAHSEDPYFKTAIAKRLKALRVKRRR